MNKSELAAELATRANLSKSQAGDVVDAIFGDAGIIASTLKKGEKVTVRGFGTFQVSARAARKGINPKTKAPLDIPASKSARFKAGKGLKDAI